MPTTTDKAVILARGRGTRMRAEDGTAPLDPRPAAVADTGVKALMPLADRPFLDYVLSTLADAGCRRVCLVVGPEQRAIRDYYARGVALQRLSIEFAIQEEPHGTADAVSAAADFAGRDPFLMLNSDNFYPLEACQALLDQPEPAVALFERDALLAGGNIPPERVARFALGEVDEAGYLRQIIEKPDAETLSRLTPPLWVSMDCWRFGPSIFWACRSIPRSPCGEFELTMAVQYAMDVLGERFLVVPQHAPVLDLTSRRDTALIEAKLAGMEVRL
jgi:glucose-1-phosphate thymidylyltransferase